MKRSPNYARRVSPFGDPRRPCCYHGELHEDTLSCCDHHASACKVRANAAPAQD